MELWEKITEFHAFEAKDLSIQRLKLNVLAGMIFTASLRTIQGRSQDFAPGFYLPLLFPSFTLPSCPLTSSFLLFLFPPRPSPLLPPNPARGLGRAVNSPSGVRGGAPASNVF